MRQKANSKNDSKSDGMSRNSLQSEAFTVIYDMLRSIDLYTDDSIPTLQERLEISTADIEKYYQAACRLLQKKEFNRAADAFFLLATLNPNHFHYWLNLGLAEQMRQNYSEALDAFGFAVLANTDDPRPHVYAAECYLALDKTAKSIDSLRIAMECSQDGKECVGVRNQIITLTKTIQKGKKKRG